MPLPRNRVLDAQAALLALRCLGLDYRPDASVPDGAWIASCPSCGVPGSLRIREVREQTDEDRNPPVAIGCMGRCAPPGVIAVVLSTDPDVLEERAETARWRAFAERLTDSYRRSSGVAA